MSDSIILQQSYIKEVMVCKVEAPHKILIRCSKIQWNNSHVNLL